MYRFDYVQDTINICLDGSNNKNNIDNYFCSTPQVANDTEKRFTLRKLQGKQ